MNRFGLGLAFGIVLGVGALALGRLGRDSRPTAQPSRATLAATQAAERAQAVPGGIAEARRAPAEEAVLPATVGIDGGDLEALRARRLLTPVVGLDTRTLRDTFSEARGQAAHEAIDILAPRGTPVVAVDDGVVQKLFTSARGGLTVYQFDPTGTWCYYYAHLERYAEGLREGQQITRGTLVGYVGTSGNAPRDTPHLHFSIFKLGPERRWWEGQAVNPYPVWAGP